MSATIWTPSRRLIMPTLAELLAFAGRRKVGGQRLRKDNQRTKCQTACCELTCNGNDATEMELTISGVNNAPDCLVYRTDPVDHPCFGEVLTKWEFLGAALNGTYTTTDLTSQNNFRMCGAFTLGGFTDHDDAGVLMVRRTDYQFCEGDPPDCDCETVIGITEWFCASLGICITCCPVGDDPTEEKLICLGGSISNCTAIDEPISMSQNFTIYPWSTDPINDPGVWTIGFPTPAHTYADTDNADFFPHCKIKAGNFIPTGEVTAIHEGDGANIQFMPGECDPAPATTDLTYVVSVT